MYKWRYLCAELFNSSCSLVIAVTETWLKPVHDSVNAISLDNYCCFRHDRVVKNGGGSLLLVHNSLCPRPVCIKFADYGVNVHESYFNIVACDVLLLGKDRQLRLRLFSVYVVPKICVEELRCLLGTLSKYIDSFDGISIICKDFNMPTISWGSLLATRDLMYHLFIDFCNQYGLHQLVNSPTRGSSIHNVVLTNGNNIVQDVVVNEPLVNCDHKYISFFIAVPLISHLNSSNKVWWYNFNKADYAGIASVLKLIDWRVFFNSCCDINDYW